MSEDGSNFLRRWAQRKRDARPPDTREAAPDASAAVPATDAEEKPAAEELAAEELDLSFLPKLEDLTGTSDVSGFLRKGVPESLRNAALSKSWALDPAIRNYVNPALEYAYDWNAPGGVPGSGDLAAGTDIAKMVLQIMGSGEPTIETRGAEPIGGPQEPEQPGAVEDVDAVPPPGDQEARAVRLAEAETAAAAAAAGEPCNAPAGRSPASGDAIAPAPQQSFRRHGAAKPRV